MKLYDIIHSNHWLSVEIILLELYPDEHSNISGYEEVFNKLKMLQPEENDTTLLVSWEKDDLDQTDYVDVSGYYSLPQEDEKEPSLFLALEFTPWTEWLGMTIDKETLKNFNELEIIAHCLFEMTFVSFDEDEIQAELDNLNKRVDDIKNMTEEERHEKLISWEDIKRKLEENRNNNDENEEE